MPRFRDLSRHYMLTELREKSQSFIIYILFGILIFVFVFFFGPQADGCMSPSTGAAPRVGWAADVNGEEITQQRVESVLRSQLLSARDNIGDSEFDSLRREALMQLIEQTVLSQRAASLGIAVSEDEISRHIIDKEKNPEFVLFTNRDGEFDYGNYRDQVTQRLGMNVVGYREAKRRQLSISHLLDFLGSQVVVSDSEVKEAYDRSETKWTLEYVAVGLDAFADLPEPTAADGETYAKAHPDDVQQYYDDNKSKYDRDKEIQVRRILLKTTNEQSEADKSAIKAKVEELLVKSRVPGADFAAIAKESSEGFYKTSGGDMGWKTKENSSAEDYAVYSTLAKGEISDLQESGIGFWFVKADDVKEPIKKTLDKVRGEIGLVLAAENRKKDAARKTAQQYLAKAKAGTSFEDIVNADVKAQPTPEPPPAPAPGEEGDDAEPNVVAVSPAPEPRFQVELTASFNDQRAKWDTIPRIGKSEALARALPTLTADKPLFEQVVETDDQFFVVRLHERVDPDSEKFEEEKVKIANRLRRQRESLFFGRWQTTVFGPVRSRATFRKFGTGALALTLPNPGSDPNISVNTEAFAAPAAEPAAAN